MDVFAGVDCGATNLRVGLVDKSGKLIGQIKVSSPLKTAATQLAQVVSDQIKTITSQQKDLHLRGIGLGTPGPLDLEKGLILPSSNIGNTLPIELKPQFKAAFDAPVYFDRDTDIALIGESWLGEAVNLKDVVMLTLGTGIGGAVMIDGKTYRGFSGKGGEIGHMIIQGGADSVCGLGHRGCFEGMLNSAQDIDRFVTYLGWGLANIVDIFDPQKIIIGGGKLSIGNFLPKALEIMIVNSIRESADDVQVVYAKLGDLSGIYGGARLAMIGKIDGAKL